MNIAFPLESLFYDNMDVVAFRVSHVNNLELRTTFNAFATALQFVRVVVSEETSQKGVLHHHGLVAIAERKAEDINIGTEVEDSLLEQAIEPSPKELRFYNLKNLVREILKKTYPDATGNKCLYVRESLNKKQLLKYTLKEGLFLQKGFSERFVQAALKLSAVKGDIKTQFTANVDAYKLGQKTFLQFKVDHVNIKIEHNQPLYANHLKSYFMMIGMQKGDISVLEYVETTFEQY